MKVRREWDVGKVGERANVCANCKHWDHDGETVSFLIYKPDDDDYDPGTEVDSKARRCLRIIHCGTETRAQCLKEGAFVKDAEEYSASLYTRAMFGCVLWELH